MGNSCSHENTEEIEKVGEYNNLLSLWRHETWKVRCLDCPKVFNVDKPIGKITKMEYKSKKIDTNGCNHKYFEVDESTKTTEHTETFGGSMLRLLTGPALDGIQYSYYYQAEATCSRCEFNFYVNANKGTKWVNQKQVDYVSSEWKPVKVTEKKMVEVPEKKFVEVKK